MNNIIIQHLVFSVVAILFFILGNQARRSKTPISFFNVMKPVEETQIDNIEVYNKSISIVYFIFALMMAIVSFIDVNKYQILVLTLISFSVIFLVIANLFILKKHKK